MASKPLTEPNQTTRYRIVQQPAPLQTRVLIKRMLAAQNMTYSEIQKKLEYHGIKLQRDDLYQHLRTLVRRNIIVVYRTALRQEYALK